MTSALSDPRCAVVFDTETTGLIENGAIPLKRQPHIIELCAVKIDLTPNCFRGAGSDEEWRSWRDNHLAQAPMFTSLFHHPKLPEETESITGISQDMVNLAPQFASKLRELQSFFFGTSIMVGHNLSYDRDMLAMELRRLDAQYKFPWPPRHICTVEATENEEGYRIGLNDLHERLTGVRFSEHHRAEPDTRATARCFMELVRAGKIKL